MGEKKSVNTFGLLRMDERHPAVSNQRLRVLYALPKLGDILRDHMINGLGSRKD